MTLRIGWLQDNIMQPVSGARTSATLLRQMAPPEVTILEIDPQALPLRRKLAVDAFVALKCDTYPPETVEFIDGKPLVTSLRDIWRSQGSSIVRQYLLDESRLVLFLSELHVSAFPYRVRAPVEICPPPFDVPWMQEQHHEYCYGPRSGTCWVGSYEYSKGVGETIGWANRTQTQVDFYGAGQLAPRDTPFTRNCGFLEPGHVLETMGRYKQFVYQPMLPDPFGRTVVEAAIMGCQLTLNDKVGCGSRALDFAFAILAGDYDAGKRFWERALQEVGT